MNTPIGLIGAAVLFWGWQTGWLVLAIPLAIAFELRHVARPAWTLDAQGVNRIADLCSLAIISVGAYLLVTLEAPRAARTIIGMVHWLPLALAPLALVQGYATRAPLDLSVLFVTLRNRPPTGVQVDFGFLYVIACVLAAAAANVRTEMYFAGAAVFSAWSLWNLRSRRYSRLAPFAVLIAASVLGYAGHVSLNRLQAAVTEWAGELADSSAQTNPYRATTDIGHIGELKLSDRILLRVSLPEGEAPPVLLHRASYNTFASPTWIARQVSFESLPGDPVSGWSLRESADRNAAVEVLEHTRSGKAILSLPSGAAHIAGLPPAELRRNRLGSVSAETAPGFLRYRAHRSTGGAVEGPPDEADTRISEPERAAVREIAARLELHGVPPPEARRRIERFFAGNFNYSTWQDASQVGRGPFAAQGARTPLANFLTRTRAGHCEYFASATALLLREAGIPARYATGFSVQERTARGDYVVRERHAHAWVRAWIDGAWVDIDTTPAQWFAIEGAQASEWQALGDAWAWIKFTWGRFQTADDDAVPRPVLFGLLAVLFLWLASRIFRSTQKREAHAAPGGAARLAPGADSDFYRIERVLAERGAGRSPSEPVFEWIDRLSRSGIDSKALSELAAIAHLHYRLRFDPLPVDGASRAELRERVERWIAEAPGPVSS